MCIDFIDRRDRRTFCGLFGRWILCALTMFQTCVKAKKDKILAKFIGGREKNKNKTKFLAKYIGGRDKNKNKKLYFFSLFGGFHVGGTEN